MSHTVDGPLEATADVAAPHAPPYHFDATHGYQTVGTEQLASEQDGQSRVQVADQSSQHAKPEHEEMVEEDDLYFSDDEEENYSDEDLSAANPSDYTKSYNRQRRQNDPSIPLEQKPKSNPQKPKANVAAMIDDQITSLSRHAPKLKLDAQQSGLGTKGDKGTHTDRADRATSEQVLDPRTRMILLQMINRGVVSEINGCISTGKEANVYHAVLYPEQTSDPTSTASASEASTITVPPPAARPVDTSPQHLAIKIFKTSILTFKDRSAYITGEYRFRAGYKHRSNHAMVRLWAEKEFRNLKRLHAAGLPVPEPIHLRAHVLVMRFIGSKKGWSAPLLRDVSFSEPSSSFSEAGDQSTTNNEADELTTTEDTQAVQRWTELYHTVLCHIRTIYTKCHLVHADLSEFNILYRASTQTAYIIDVGQSVEHDHPRSLDFLRKDIANVTVFFAKKGVSTLSEQVTFGFVTAEKGASDTPGMRQALVSLVEAAEAKVEAAGPDADLVHGNENVFREQFMPQNLRQVYDIERDAEKVQRGEASELVYQSLLADGQKPRDRASDDVAVANGHVQAVAEDEANAAASPSSGSVSDDESSGEYSDAFNEDGTPKGPQQPRGKRFEDKTVRKEHKASVKEEKREKRKTKMPKHVKKKIMSSTSRGHKK